LEPASRDRFVEIVEIPKSYSETLKDERAKIVRRTIVRYICATFTITLTMLSPKVKKRFPTLEHYIGAGLLTKDEIKIMNDLDNEFPSYSKYW
jgi:hypothetical protein